MITLNILQIILISIIILLGSAILEQYQDDLLESLNERIPSLIQVFTKSAKSQASENSEILKLIDSYKTILGSTENELQSNKDALKNTNLAFGYVADLDIYVDALELMQNLGFHNFQEPKFHDNLHNKQEIGETFSFYFQKGAGSELFVQNKQLFDEIVEISRKISKKQSLGGNASTMAARAFKEGANVILGHAINQQFFQEVFNSSATLVEELQEIRDIHLVLDFYKDKPWGTKTTPRSNRMYLNHDIENSQLTYMERLHNYIKQAKNIQLDILGLGGFQLLNHRNSTQIAEQMIKLGDELLEIRQYGPKIHIELGTFTDDHLLSELIKNPLLQADSIGLNEQELKNIITYLEKQSVIDATQSEFEYNQAIKDVIKLIGLLHKYKFNTNRIHYHTINMQMICSNVDEWMSSKIALVKSIVIALQESENKGKNFFEFEPEKMKISIPEQLNLPLFDDTFNLIDNEEHQKTIEFNVEDPVKCWNPHKSIECCVAPNIQVIHPQKTCGLGDNISSTGLIYHKVNSQQS